MNPIIKEDLRMILDKEIKWEKLRNKTIMITGASGMVGSYFVRTLIELNENENMNIHICCVVRNINKIDSEILAKQYVTAIAHDVTKPFVYDGRLDYIIHAASPASPLIMKDKPVETIAANTLGAYYTLELAKDKKVSGYMFISSREIYGQPFEDQEYFYENTYGLVDPLQVRSCYPEGKKAAETMCVCYKEQYGINTKIARLAHTYGPGMSIYDGRVQADFLKNVLFKENIVLKSDGSSVRTYTYIADAVAGMFYILLNGENIAYNVGDENGKVSIRELAQLLLDLNPDKKLKLDFNIPQNATTGCAPFTKGILSSESLRQLGWKPENSINEGFKRTLAYLEIEKENGNL